MCVCVAMCVSVCSVMHAFVMYAVVCWSVYCDVLFDRRCEQVTRLWLALWQPSRRHVVGFDPRHAHLTLVCVHRCALLSVRCCDVFSVAVCVLLSLLCPAPCCCVSLFVALLFLVSVSLCVLLCSCERCCDVCCCRCSVCGCSVWRCCVSLCVLLSLS